MESNASRSPRFARSTSSTCIERLASAAQVAASMSMEPAACETFIAGPTGMAKPHPRGGWGCPLLGRTKVSSRWRARSVDYDRVGRAFPVHPRREPLDALGVLGCQCLGDEHLPRRLDVRLAGIDVPRA